MISLTACKSILNDTGHIDNADEPVMIGGGYLTCTKVDENSNRIACGLIDKKFSNKINLKNYEYK